MKRRGKWILAILFVLIIVLTGCTDPIQTGDLTITSNSIVKTILPDKSVITCASYKLYGTHAEQTIEIPFTGTTTTVSELNIGPWQMYVEGYNSENLLIGKSVVQDVTIVPGSGNKATFEVKYLTEGKGSFNTEFIVPLESNVNKIELVVFNKIGSQTLTSDTCSEAAGKKNFSKVFSLDAGSYDLLINLIDANGSNIGFTIMESLVIHPNITSHYAFEFPSVFFPTEVPVITSSNGQDTVTSANTISIVTATQGATIKYTTDGTDPRITGTIYTAPFNVTKNTVVKAYAYKSGLSDSITAVKHFYVQAAAPSVTPDAGTEPFETAQTVTLQTTTPESTIYYSLDGSSPVGGQVYEKAITIDKNTVLKAYAVNKDYLDSPVISKGYNIRVQAPVIGPQIQFETVGNLTISNPVPGATIHYSIANGDWLDYNAPIKFSDSANIKAYSSKQGMTDSLIVSADIVVLKQKLTQPTFPFQDGYVFQDGDTFPIHTGYGARPYYSFDPELPKSEWIPSDDTIREQWVKVHESGIVYAFSRKANYIDSDVKSVSYKVKAISPCFSVKAGGYSEPQTVVITTGTENSRIYYTLDGTVPNSSTSKSIASGESIVINKTTTLKAITIKPNLEVSDVTSALYELDGAGSITVTPPEAYKNFKIEIPADMAGKSVVPGVMMTLSTNIPDASYVWYVDGMPASSASGLDLSCNKKLLLGTDPTYNLNLQEGFHAITAVTEIGGIKYTDNYYVLVESTGTGFSGINFNREGVSKISGTYDAGNKFTKAGSPYYIVGDTTLNSEIEPGTEFLVTGPYQVSYNGTNIGGAPNNRIIFRGIDAGRDKYNFGGNFKKMSHVDVLASKTCFPNYKTTNIDNMRIETAPGCVIGSNSIGYEVIVSNCDIKADLQGYYSNVTNTSVDGYLYLYDSVAKNLNVNGQVFISQSVLDSGTMKGDIIIHDTIMANMDLSDKLTIERSVITYSDIHNAVVDFYSVVLSYSNIDRCANPKIYGMIQYCNLINFGTIKSRGNISHNFWGQENNAIWDVTLPGEKPSFITADRLNDVILSSHKTVAYEGIGCQGPNGITPIDTTAFAFDVGDCGPAGGIICGTFYRNNKLMRLEWLPTSYSLKPYARFGEWRDSLNGAAKEIGTDTRIGSGQWNTEKIVRTMGDHAYAYDDDFGSLYAARVVSDFVFASFDDWYIPSADEADLIAETKAEPIQMQIHPVLTSSEANATEVYSWKRKEGFRNIPKYGGGCVVPVREF